MKAALEEAQPFKVEVASPKRGFIIDLNLPSALAAISPQTGKQWELLSGSIYHAGANDSTLQCLNQDLETYFLDGQVAAAAVGIYPVDLRGSRVIIQQSDGIVLTGAAASYANVRMLETDV